MTSLAHSLACLAFVCVVALPVAWLISEFTSKRWLRLSLGIAMMVTGLVLAHGWGQTGGVWQTNDWFARVNTRLIDGTIKQLETGDSKAVLASLKQLRQKYDPNYDTRSNLDQLVDEAVRTMQSANASAPATDH
jgi:hypothetical protein